MRVTVSENGRRRTLKVCEEDYAALRAQQSSPFESLFGGGLLGGDLFRDFFGELGDEGAARASRPTGRGRGRDRESLDLSEYLSEQGEEILQAAARTAAEWGAREVDSEHLLHALAENDVVRPSSLGSRSSRRISRTRSARWRPSGSGRNPPLARRSGCRPG